MDRLEQIDSRLVDATKHDNGIGSQSDSVVGVHICAIQWHIFNNAKIAVAQSTVVWPAKS